MSLINVNLTKSTNYETLFAVFTLLSQLCLQCTDAKVGNEEICENAVRLHKNPLDTFIHNKVKYLHRH